MDTCSQRRITSKAQFFELWEAGMLGNKLRTWRDPIQAHKEARGEVGFRALGKSGGGQFKITGGLGILYTGFEWRDRQFVICESAPDHLAVIQGEVQQGVGGWQGFLAVPVKDGKRMRESMRDDARQYYGLQVREVLGRYMDPSSFADLEGLLDVYEDAVVEFTTYSINLGCLPGRNTIFWECRNY